jgi:ATP-dependent RNA helicase HelY
VAGLAKQIRHNEQTLREYERELTCDQGDIREYARLRRELSEREGELSRQGAKTRRAAVAKSLESLRPGDVIRVPSGRRAGLAIVLDPGVHHRDDPHPLVVTEGRWAGRLSMVDFPVTAEVLGTVRVPKKVDHRSPQVRRDLVSSLRALGIGEPARPRRKQRSSAVDDEDVLKLRAELRAHPCHGCNDRDQHMRWAERSARLERDTNDLRRRIEGRTGSLGRRFDRICRLLDRRGYLAQDETTPAGRQLARIWSEADLVIAECLRAGAWDGLDAAELAAVASVLVYEPRRDEQPVDRAPTAAMREALATTVRVWARVVEDEEELGLSPSREPQPGLVGAMYRWARGDRLDAALDAAAYNGTELSAGDFVRWCKQVLDLLEQLATVPAPGGDPEPFAATARAAAAAVRRGVVAQSMQV